MGFGVQVVTAFQGIRELAAVYVVRQAEMLKDMSLTPKKRISARLLWSADANSFKSRMLPMTSVSKVKAG